MTFLQLLEKYKKQYGFKVFAFILMHNHFHLLLELPSQKDDTDKGDLSDIMHDENSSYTKYFNAKYKVKGHLFRERFKAALIEKGPYLVRLTAYMHLNPKRVNVGADPASYPYSSYMVYLDKEVPFKNLSKEEKDEVLGLLANMNYEQVMEEVDKDESMDWHKQLHRRGIIGGEDFQKKVREEYESLKKEEIEKEEEEEPKVLNPMLKSGIIIFATIMIGSALTFYLRLALREKPKSGGQQAAVTPTAAIKVSEIELDGTEWMIRLIPQGGGPEEADTIMFKDHRFISGKLNASGFIASSYSYTMENDKTNIWETVQSGPTGTASWHGEVGQGKMEGILSLRKSDGSTQAYSFSSIKYWRAK